MTSQQFLALIQSIRAIHSLMLANSPGFEEIREKLLNESISLMEEAFDISHLMFTNSELDRIIKTIED